jgi:acetyltransferase EpsM
MSRRLLIAGGGEHARVVAEAATAAGWEPVGWTGPAHETPASALPWAGTDDQVAVTLAATAASDRPWLVLGFGAPVEVRRRVVARFGDEARWATVVHPTAWVSPSAVLGPGVVVLAHALVNTGAVVGAHAIINSAAVVEHDVRVGAHAHLAPAAAIGGGSRIGDGTLVALGATVRDHISVGDDATVGMGAVVVADVPDGAVVVGVPARVRDDTGARPGPSSNGGADR